MSALALRILACVSMLLDHLGYCYPQLHFLRYVGRLAFPVYVFLIVNGYTHTSSRLRYALRLGLMAVISQIPFSLFCHYDSFFEKYNVFFSLLCALLVVWATDGLLKFKLTRWLSFLPWLLMTAAYFFGYVEADYGIKAVWMALSFRYLKKSKLLTLLGCFLSVYAMPILGYALQVLLLLLGREARFVPPDRWTLTQAISLLALIPIFLYNGKKGTAPKNRAAAKALQWGFYLFYPLHLLLLYLIS